MIETKKSLELRLAIKAAIKVKGLKQLYVATQVNMLPEALCYYLSGKRHYYTKRNELATFLGIKIS